MITERRSAFGKKYFVTAGLFDLAYDISDISRSNKLPLFDIYRKPRFRASLYQIRLPA